MNDERNAMIVKLWNDGLSASTVARSLGVPVTLVSSLIHRRRKSGEITRPKATSSMNDERNAKIVRLWNSGLSAKEIGLSLGVTKNVVLAAIVKHRAFGDITRPMVESRAERGKLAMIARYGLRKKKK